MRKAWDATVHSVVGFPVAVAAHLVTVLVGVYALLLGLTVLGAPAGLNSLFATSRGLSAVQRSRFAALLGVTLRPQLAQHPRPLAAVGSAAVWRPLGYHVLVGLLVSSLGFAVLISLWALAVLLVLAAVREQDAPAEFFGVLVQPGEVPPAALLAAGALCGFLAIRLAAPLAALDARAAQALLEPSRADLLEQRVQVLTESRSEVVSAADAERRRIERDLHDGAQQRLVSLAMKLGMARDELPDVDDHTRRVIEDAHDEAKQALTELRNLVRGLHPAVLEDRGLDAALSGVAARSPVPTTVSVSIDRRPSSTVEAVAYFVVSEALSNVAKHSGASRASIEVRREGDILRLRVSDDGRGGADPGGGTGLRGLGQRVGSVDGVLRVDSPAGGPTVITVEMPCES